MRNTSMFNLVDYAEEECRKRHFKLVSLAFFFNTYFFSSFRFLSYAAGRCNLTFRRIRRLNRRELELLHCPRRAVSNTPKQLCQYKRKSQLDLAKLSFVIFLRSCLVSFLFGRFGPEFGPSIILTFMDVKKLPPLVWVFCFPSMAC